MASKKNIKFRTTKDGKVEAYDSITGKSLGYVQDMTSMSKKSTKKSTKKSK